MSEKSNKRKIDETEVPETPSKKQKKERKITSEISKKELESFTVPELKNYLQENNITFKANALKKVLVALVWKNRDPTKIANEEATSEIETDEKKDEQEEFTENKEIKVNEKKENTSEKKEASPKKNEQTEKNEHTEKKETSEKKENTTEKKETTDLPPSTGFVFGASTVNNKLFDEYMEPPSGSKFVAPTTEITSTGPVTGGFQFGTTTVNNKLFDEYMEPPSGSKFVVPTETTSNGPVTGFQFGTTTTTEKETPKTDALPSAGFVFGASTVNNKLFDEYMEPPSGSKFVVPTETTSNGPVTGFQFGTATQVNEKMFADCKPTGFGDSFKLNQLPEAELSKQIFGNVDQKEPINVDPLEKRQGK